MKDGIEVGEIPAVISDNGWVRIGNAGPAFPVMRPLVRGRPISVGDTGEVRIGDYSAVSSSGSTADAPNVRIAAVRPTATPVRSR